MNDLWRWQQSDFLRYTNQLPEQTWKRYQWPAITAAPRKQRSLKWQGRASLGDLWVKAVGKRERERESINCFYISAHKLKINLHKKKKGLTTVQSSRSNTILEDLKFQRTIFSFHCDTSFFRQCSMSVKYLVFEFSVTLQSFLTQSKMKSFWICHIVTKHYHLDKK